MARRKSLDVFKRDSLLLEFLKQHKGAENIVTSKEIMDFLNNNGYETIKSNVWQIIRRIMFERNAPICFSNAKGYYWAQTRAEIQTTIADMESRIFALNKHIEHLKNFIIE
jgi:hypothetical protein